jgi:hypothetical protein
MAASVVTLLNGVIEAMVKNPEKYKTHLVGKKDCLTQFGHSGQYKS